MEHYWSLVATGLSIILLAVSLGLFLSTRELRKSYQAVLNEFQESKKQVHELTWRDRLKKPPFSQEEMIKRINGLDLTSVQRSLKDEDWDEGLLKETEKEYLQFLFLFGVSGVRVCPWTKRLDLFWHRHILDMKKYEEDCLALFGMVLYHKPSIGEDLKEDERRTKRLYAQHFTPIPFTAKQGGVTRRLNPSVSTTNAYQESDSWLPWMMFAYILMNDSTSANVHEELGISQDHLTSLGSAPFVEQDSPRSEGVSSVSNASVATTDYAGSSESHSHASSDSGSHSSSSASCSGGSSCSGGGSSCGGGG